MGLSMAPLVLAAPWGEESGKDEPGFGCLAYSILWSLDHFKLLCTQDLNTVSTGADEVPVVWKISSASRREGLPNKAGGEAGFLPHGREAHSLHYRVCCTLGQLHGGDSCPAWKERLQTTPGREPQGT